MFKNDENFDRNSFHKLHYSWIGDYLDVLIFSNVFSIECTSTTFFFVFIDLFFFLTYNFVFIFIMLLDILFFRYNKIITSASLFLNNNNKLSCCWCNFFRTISKIPMYLISFLQKKITIPVFFFYPSTSTRRIILDSRAEYTLSLQIIV